MSDTAPTRRAGPILWASVLAVVLGVVVLAVMKRTTPPVTPPDVIDAEDAGVAPPMPTSGIFERSPGAMIDVAAVERSGRSLRTGELGGGWLAVAFLFTSCGNTCPRLAAELKKFADATASDSALRVVAFTVQPGTDTPGVLSEYAKRFDADVAHWLFLRTSADDVQAVARGLAVNNSPTNPILHANSVTIVDPKGRVVAKYEPLNDPDWVSRAVGDLEVLRRTGGPR